MIGVRCLGPANWTVYVQVNISVTGNFLASTRTLPSGTMLTSDDIAVRSGDLTTFPNSILTDPTQAIGKRLRAGIMSGAPLRSDLLVASWAILQGQTVRTVANGSGFSVSSEGKAISNALDGQVVQVRTSSGQIVSGIAKPNGIVDVSH
ncbi:flagella basal body P-ring formation protein FlgA [Propionivibrio dicarboxylicus]|uniref:Flagella basal body P-ring formation protein FlgA n=2 Tax=Propionivibrio dicarboxylicus TaxID=83767 RepID=A0A1G8HFA1_9RHOO|nr:flagella basal body P-ring formation protein FlgA [Propionivibrio dicarboxylicus]